MTEACGGFNRSLVLQQHGSVLKPLPNVIEHEREVPTVGELIRKY